MVQPSQTWIAIEPLSRNPETGKCTPILKFWSTHFSLVHRGQSSNSMDPPSFRESQFDIILRRQRLRPKDGGGLKLPGVPSRFLNLSSDFEFAGWGSFSKLKLNTEDHRAGEDRLQAIRSEKILGQFTASALVGNAVLGGVFYTLPAVVVVSNV
jgi:hypothetical protein